VSEWASEWFSDRRCECVSVRACRVCVHVCVGWYPLSRLSRNAFSIYLIGFFVRSARTHTHTSPLSRRRTRGVTATLAIYTCNTRTHTRTHTTYFIEACCGVVSVQTRKWTEAFEVHADACTHADACMHTPAYTHTHAHTSALTQYAHAQPRRRHIHTLSFDPVLCPSPTHS